MNKDVFNKVECDKYLKVLNSNISSIKKKKGVLNKLFDGNYSDDNIGIYQYLLKNLNNKKTLNLIGNNYADRLFDLIVFSPSPSSIAYYAKMDILTDTFIETFLNRDISRGLLFLLEICKYNGNKDNINDILYKFSNYASKKMQKGFEDVKSKNPKEEPLSEEAIKFLEENIPNNRLVDYLANKNVPKNVKDYLMKTRNADILEVLRNHLPFYGSDDNVPDEIQDTLIMHTPNEDLFRLLSADYVSTELKDRIFELRKEDILKAKISDELMFEMNFAGKYLDYLLSDKDGYFIFQLLRNIGFNNDDKKKYILRKKHEELKKYLYREPLNKTDNYELREFLRQDKLFQSEDNIKIKKDLLDILEINSIVYNDELIDSKKLDKILTYNDEQVIGVLLRFYEYQKYRNLLKNMYLRKKEVFNNYFKMNPDDIIILRNVDIKFDYIKNLLVNAPFLPIFIKALHEDTTVYYGQEKSTFIDDVLSSIYLSDNNRGIIDEYLNNNPDEYFYLEDKNRELVNMILNNISEKNVIYILFRTKEHIIKPMVYENKIEYIVKYLNSNYKDIIYVPSFMDVTTFKNELLPKLSDSIIISLLCDKEIISNKLYKDDELSKLFKILFEDRKNKIFEYLDNNNIKYDFLLYYDLLPNDITNIIAKITDEDLINIFVKFGKEMFDLKENILNIIYRNKKSLILKEFIYDNDKFSFILNLKINDEDFENIINELDSQSLNKMVNNEIYPSDVRKKVLEYLLLKSNNIPFDSGLVDDIFAVWDMLVSKGNDTIIINNLASIIEFMNKCNSSLDKMLQYEANVEYDWIKDMLDIINSNKTDIFAKIKDSFYSLYFNFDGSENEILYYENLLLLIKNFHRYPDLCIDIADNALNLTSEEKNKISFLFNKKERIDVNKISELKNINSIIKNNYLSIFDNLDKLELDAIKNSVSLIIFNSEIDELKNILKKYGNREDFIQLRFNNRCNKVILNYIDEMLVYVTLIEDFANCNNFELLKKIAKNVFDNFDEVIDISILFNGLEKKMRDFFEMEANINLTNLYDEEVYNSVLNEPLSTRYGVDVLDFRDRQYLFYEHQKSRREKIEDLVKGKSTGNQNFISLIPISHRKNNYYNSWSNNIKLIYCNISKGTYIMSSLHNMNSNKFLRKNKTKVESVSRYQRGILETSDNSDYTNPETLCYREGLVPFGINITGDEDKNQLNEIVDTAKKYGLKLILTQGANKNITNPKMNFQVNKSVGVNKQNFEQIKELKEKLNKLVSLKPNNNERKIAILTDSHALFKPTLAVLEDARKEGVTEIYSLGDNIGTGPNPGEVVDLLNSYGVKSVKGNHELYTLLGTDTFKKHLHGSALKEAEENSNWTRLHLTDKQLEIIRNYPDKIELNVGGKKVLLTHYIKDLRTNKIIINSRNYDQIFEGHVHYNKEVNNIKTLRGLGIGTSSDKGKAYYIILREKENGYDIEEREVPFNLNSLYHDINESNLSLSDKDKIMNWTGTHHK